MRAKREKAKQTEITSWKKRKKEIEDGQVKDKFRGTLVETTANEERWEKRRDAVQKRF